MITPNKFSYKKLQFSDFTVASFIEILMESLNLDTKYYLLFSIGYNNNHQYLMCGPQIIIKVLKNHNISVYEKIYEF